MFCWDLNFIQFKCGQKKELTHNSPNMKNASQKEISEIFLFSISLKGNFIILNGIISIID